MTVDDWDDFAIIADWHTAETHYRLARPLTSAGVAFLRALRRSPAAGEPTQPTIDRWWASEQGKRTTFGIWGKNVGGMMPLWVVTRYEQDDIGIHVLIPAHRSSVPFQPALVSSFRLLGFDEGPESDLGDWIVGRPPLRGALIKSLDVAPETPDISTYTLLGLNPWTMPLVDFGPWYRELKGGE